MLANTILIKKKRKNDVVCGNNVAQCTCLQIRLGLCIQCCFRHTASSCLHAAQTFISLNHILVLTLIIASMINHDIGRFGECSKGQADPRILWVALSGAGQEAARNTLGTNSIQGHFEGVILTAASSLKCTRW